MPRLEDERQSEKDPVAVAIAKAKFKNDRLRLLKARHERYLAEHREEDAEDRTPELHS